MDSRQAVITFWCFAKIGDGTWHYSRVGSGSYTAYDETQGAFLARVNATFLDQAIDGNVLESDCYWFPKRGNALRHRKNARIDYFAWYHRRCNCDLLLTDAVINTKWKWEGA